ncbi:MAG: hypothetical protein AUK55_03080 [Syntrophobacteraceae bacterium CG2_30_61_12]|nr:MAG: hypothetical protein AUK55_03080 [Syntrophobacteraceae bacterium CG2_30_61_12]PIU31856.1 MAG: hypothetical protein COT06_05885 [Syntrophobacteraceae bacterium CG07_land_8_20_14_0_80_61_8]
MERERQPGPAGFTLVELMVVLILIALASAMIIPKVGAGWGRLEEKEFLQELVRTLRGARVRAMNTGTTVVFGILGDERRYGVGPALNRKIPDNIRINAENMEVDRAAGQHLIRFYPDGSQTGAELQVIVDERKYFRISLNPLFGTVSWRRES